MGIDLNGSKTPAVNGDGCIMLWPYKEFCELMPLPDYIPLAMEVHDFLAQCTSLENTVGFCIFPTNENSYTVSAEQLRLDIQEYLDELE